MLDPAIASFLLRRGGLLAEALGPDAVAAEHGRRAGELGLSTSQYSARLEHDEAEASRLLEAVVVPETWFYRDIEPFEQVSRWARGRGGEAKVRALSLPCSTGEEAYSLVIALLEGGVSGEQIEVHGWDISRRALARASEAFYGRFSLRMTPAWLVSRYLVAEGSGHRVAPGVRERVRLSARNAIEVTRGEGPFDVVLCRNLLIYLERGARERLLGELAALLSPGGLLVLGHADGVPGAALGLRAEGPPGAFAFVRGEAAPGGRAVSAPRPKQASKSVHVNAHKAAPPPRAPAERDLEEARRLADRGELDEARDLCIALLRRRPLDAGAHRLLGLIHAARGELREAEASLRKALYLAPDDDETLAHLSLIASRQGKTEQAEAFRRRRAAAQKGSAP